MDRARISQIDTELLATDGMHTKRGDANFLEGTSAVLSDCETEGNVHSQTPNG